MSTRVGREVARHRGGETPVVLATMEAKTTATWVVARRLGTVKADWEKVCLDKVSGDKGSGRRDTTAGLVVQVLPRHGESL